MYKNELPGSLTRIAEISLTNMITNQKAIRHRYLGWDVVVNYKGNTDGLLNSLDTISRNGPHCAWPDFRLRGQFKRRIIYSLYFRGDHYDGIYFDTDDATAVYSSNMNCPEVKLP